MPFELELEELDVEVVADAPPEEPEALVDWLVDGVDELVVEALEPQAATPSATNTISAAARWRGDLVIVDFIMTPVFVRPRENPPALT